MFCAPNFFPHFALHDIHLATRLSSGADLIGFPHSLQTAFCAAKRRSPEHRPARTPRSAHRFFSSSPEQPFRPQDFPLPPLVWEKKFRRREEGRKERKRTNEPREHTEVETREKRTDRTPSLAETRAHGSTLFRPTARNARYSGGPGAPLT